MHNVSCSQLKNADDKAKHILDNIDDIDTQISKRGDRFKVGNDEYFYGGEYHNNEGFLPKNCTYKEYDINPLNNGRRWTSKNSPNNEWAERLIVGSDGSAYVVTDHYSTGLGQGITKIR